MAFAKGHKPAQTGRGACYRWLCEHATYSGNDCLTWPFSRHPTGYGSFGYLGTMHYAHRFMCELVNGPAPTKKHYASHTCSNGHNGCVSPKHLVWKTPYENALDRIAAGRQMKHGRKRNKLTKDQASEIRALKGRVPQYLLATLYGVSRETISGIHTGRCHPVKS